jgi:hypothetical protein
MIAMIGVFHTNPRHSWIILETHRASERFVTCIGRSETGSRPYDSWTGLSNFRLWEGLSAVRTCDIVGGIVCGYEPIIPSEKLILQFPKDGENWPAASDDGLSSSWCWVFCKKEKQNGGGEEGWVVDVLLLLLLVVLIIMLVVGGGYFSP